MRETGAGGFYKPLPLPEGMALSSSDVIASLNEHLIVALQVLFFISVCDKIAFIARIMNRLMCIVLCIVDYLHVHVSRISGFS